MCVPAFSLTCCRIKFKKGGEGGADGNIWKLSGSGERSNGFMPYALQSGEEGTLSPDPYLCFMMDCMQMASRLMPAGCHRLVLFPEKTSDDGLYFPTG